MLRGDQGCWGRSSRHRPQGVRPDCLQMLPYWERRATQLLFGFGVVVGGGGMRFSEPGKPACHFLSGNGFQNGPRAESAGYHSVVPRGCASSIPTSSPPEGQHPTFLGHFGDKIKGTQVGEFGVDCWQLLGAFKIIECSYSILSNMFIMPRPPLQTRVERRRDLILTCEMKATRESKNPAS